MTSLTVHSQKTLKSANVDTVKCLTNAQLKVINGVFLDLDYCEQINDSLCKIIELQDTLIISHAEVIQAFKSQSYEVKQLRYEFKESKSLYEMRLEELKLDNKKLEKQITKQSRKLGFSLGAITFTAIIFSLIPVIIK